VFAYGRNGLGVFDPEKKALYANILRSVDLGGRHFPDSLRETLQLGNTQAYYRENREKLEDDFHRMGKQAYKNYLKSIKKPYIKIEDLIDEFIEDADLRDARKLKRLDHVYERIKTSEFQSEWIISYWNDKHMSFGNRMFFFEDWEGFGLRFTMINDLIYITGPFSVFSVYSTFQEGISQEIRNYYHHTFKRIFKAFKSDFILYAHEWSGIEDEEDPDFNFKKLSEQADWKLYGSDSIHSFDRFYYEKL
jgi:hypothetical protein